MVSDSAKTLWDKLRGMIHDLSKISVPIEEGLDSIINNLRNAASIMARIRDPPLITRDYMYNIVELAKSTSIARWYVDNVLEGRTEFLGRLKEESANILKLAQRVYRSYKNRFRLLLFNVLTPIMIASLDIVLMGVTNTLYTALLLGLAGLSIILLPISPRAHGLALIALSFTSVFIIPQIVKDMFLWTIAFLYSIIGAVSGFTAYYASSVRDKFRIIVEDVLRRVGSVELPREVKEEVEKTTIDDEKLLSMLIKTYRELYGEAGKEILQYRLGILMRLGYSRRKALEELVRELDAKIDRNKT